MRILVEVVEVRRECAAGYEPGDRFEFQDFVLKGGNKGVCIHALLAMSSSVVSMLRGASTVELGLSGEEDVAYVQCPDPGPPYTPGGTVVFRLRRIFD